MPRPLGCNSASDCAIETIMSKRTLQEAASELRRELGIRRRCYGRWIQDGKLDEVEASRQEAIDARLPASVFADIDAQVQTARGALEAISASLQKKDLLAARSSAETLKASVLPLPERLREARLLWETEHPARRRRSGARR